MDLNGSKFGDKYVTRDGRIAIVIGEHKTARKHWYDFICLEDVSDMINDTPYKFWAYDDGTAFEGFEWLDIISKID
jgi:uncharacterized protein (DUF1330 family)